MGLANSAVMSHGAESLGTPFFLELDTPYYATLKPMNNAKFVSKYITRKIILDTTRPFKGTYACKPVLIRSHELKHVS